MGVIGIELEDAINVIINHTKSITETEVIPVMNSGQRILAQDLTAAFDQPPFARSPLDGYTFDAAAAGQADKDNPVLLEVTDTVYAGEYLSYQIPFGKAVKITTGAPIPNGCNCVIRQEDVKAEENQIAVFTPMSPFQNYCFAGEDFKKGAHLLNQGEQISFVEMGILASAGCHQVSVLKRPKIALFATGDELLLPGEALLDGKIYDSNLSMIYGRLQELGMDVICAKQLKDDPEEAARELEQISATADAIITTGGVSVGEKDIFHQILPILKCERLFWRVLMKPGTPAMFSVLNDTPMLNLSGNPFAAITTFELLARPMLHQLYPSNQLVMKKARAVLSNSFDKESRGRRFIRACYNGNTVIMPEVHKHASGVLASMKGCNCLIDIAADTEKLEVGDQVDILLL